MQLDIIKTPSLLLSKDNKEVVRSFEDNYIITEFKKYRSLRVPDSDIVKFFHKAQITGANPILDEIYLIPRNTKVGNEYMVVGTIIFNYHFVEFKAQKSGEYGGISAVTGPGKYFNPVTRKEETELKSTATVIRNGKNFEFTAWWPEYVQTNYKGEINAQWRTKPLLMLEKCARAGALRSAFPEWLNGSYTAEEMGAIERDDSFVEAQFEIQKESERKEVIQERIDQKDENKENSEEIKIVINEIRGMMGVVTHDIKDIQEKGKLMFTLLGVRAFSDLEKKSLDELNSRLKSLVAYNDELKLKNKTQEERPSFKLENN